MDEKSDPLEEFWNDLLSAEPERVRRAFYNLDNDTRNYVIAHLRRMASEAGWQAAQQSSARAALIALADDFDT